MTHKKRKLRQDMNVEDEYFKTIENRDEAIMLRGKKIAERDAAITERDATITELGATIAEKDDMLRKTIEMLVAVGTDYETIAVNLHITIEDVARIAKE